MVNVIIHNCIIGLLFIGNYVNEFRRSYRAFPDIRSN